ncbi:MAG: site-specific integrase [Candidatus Gastranaerophilales bacterium]|nr:site-specific integrase [Candidatus Gastranaerophilales bacterium]
MGVYEKNNHWYFEIMIRKKRYCRAIPEATCKKDAEKYLTVFKADLLRGKLDLAENVGQKPFVEIADMYIKYAETNLCATDTAVRIAKRFKELWKGKTIADITPKVIESYKESRQKTTFARKTVDGKEVYKNISSATINRELAALSKMFSLAIANGYARENPLREINKLRVVNKLERHLSIEEEKRMYQVCDDDFSFSKLPLEEQERLQRIHNGEHAYLKPILIMALNTAMRKGEILNMTWDCVDFEKNEISALNTKNGKKNTIPMSSKLRETLLELYKTKGNNIYVFTNPYTGTKYNDIKKCFKTVCKLANVKNLRFHDLRHTGATRMVAAGVPLPVVKQILNHASIQTTMRYAHTMREQEVLAVEALANFN